VTCENGCLVDEAKQAFVLARATALAPAEQRHLDRRLASLD
jgi:hypothetical protein